MTDTSDVRIDDRREPRSDADDLLPSVYDIYALGQPVKWTGDPCWIERDATGVVIDHNYVGSPAERLGLLIRVRFDSRVNHVLPIFMNVSPRDVMPI